MSEGILSSGKNSENLNGGDLMEKKREVEKCPVCGEKVWVIDGILAEHSFDEIGNPCPTSQEEWEKIKEGSEE